MSKRYPEGDTVNMIEADREYSYRFPESTKSFTFQPRSGVSFKHAYKAGDIALGKYMTAHQGIGKMEEDMGLSAPLTIYFSCETAGEVMEVEFWR